MTPIKLNNITDLTKLTHTKDLIVKCDISFKTQSGIIATVIPEVLNDRPTSGEVVLIGDKVKNIEIGDTVYFSKVTGMDIHTNEFKNGILYILMRNKSILGKLENKGN